MAGSLHGSARTTPRVRAELQASQDTTSILAQRYGLSRTTVTKWRTRTTTHDAPMGPTAPHSTVLTLSEETMVVEFRRRTLLPLDDVRRSSRNDVLGCLRDSIPKLTRSSLHRCLERHGISRLPENPDKGSKRGKFAATAIGYVHIDMSELRLAGGKLKHAQVLLRADEGEAADGTDGGPGWCDTRIAEAVGVGVATVQRLRQRFVEEGFAAALGTYRSGTRAYERKLDGAQEAHLIALASAARRRTAGRAGRGACWPAGWSSCGTPTWCRTRPCGRHSKNALKTHLRRMWCIPLKQPAEFIFHMEDALEVYHRPYDPKRPVVCVEPSGSPDMDETFKQLIGETREPLPAQPGAVERHDHVYTRNGVASLFMACEPLAGWRHAAATAHRCRSDWTHFVRDLLDGRYRGAERAVLVMDQLNTHSPASLYQAFAPEEAKRLADRLEIHHTPKHGSWLNMVEIELGALGRQCLARRIAQHDTLCRDVAAWEKQRNSAHAKVTWQFTTDQACVKLKSFYPSVQS